MVQRLGCVCSGEAIIRRSDMEMGWGLTVVGSEGTSPCKLRTIPTSCIASNTG
jgi:hypothetical protein